jgi:murein DD-endopeptidase MepM/ murein hydrolase activator NlpD
LKNGFAAACEKFLLRAGHALEHHPKQVTAAIATLLLGGAGAAFGVASLDPQPDTVVVRQVLEDVAPLPVDEQLQQIENSSMSLYRSDRTRLAETVDAFLARMGVDDPAAASFLRREPSFRTQFLAHAGRSVSVESNDRHQLVKFTGRWVADSLTSFKRLVVERAGNAFVSHVETAPLTASVHLGSALVRTSLFAAADEVNVPDAVVSQMVEIFASEIDFHRDLRLGDRFSVVYETLDADGEPMRTGRILSAEFVNAGTAYNSVWFQAPGRKGGYYTLDGKSLETSYLPTPLQYSRVSSGFRMRFHPILHEWKAHLGVDYAAAMGTPVRTVGDGKVEFAGVQNGFGNVVIVRHNTTEETVYAHLSRIRVRPGEQVEQGETIGNVGMTGWATGPHLHFEFRVNGVHQNPTLMMARHNQENAVPDALRPQFALVANSARLQLAAAVRELTVASAQ